MAALVGHELLHAIAHVVDGLHVRLRHGQAGQLELLGDVVEQLLPMVYLWENGRPAVVLEEIIGDRLVT